MEFKNWVLEFILDSDIRFAFYIQLKTNKNHTEKTLKRVVLCGIMC